MCIPCPGQPFLCVLLSTLQAACFASLTLSEKASKPQKQLQQPLPVGTLRGDQALRYIWDGNQIKAVNPEDLLAPKSPKARFFDDLRSLQSSVVSAFFPRKCQVTPDYWQYAKWRALHRCCSSMLSVLATQSLLRAVGVGAAKSLPTAAGINWVLKDGLGRIGRLTVATRFGQSFDADLKRFSFCTSVLYSAAVGLECLTPLAPRYFLPLASLANVGKSVGLITHIATQPSFQKSFARHENLADIAAKSQAQQMVSDNLGLAAAVALAYLSRNALKDPNWLPLAAFPLLAAGDLFSIHRSLKAIHLRTLNKERAELIAHSWLERGRAPSAQEISEQEHLLFPHCIGKGALPLQICSLERTVQTPPRLHRLLYRYRDEQYLLSFQPSTVGLPQKVLSKQHHSGRQGQLSIALHQSADPQSVLLGVLQAAFFRQLMKGDAAGSHRLELHGNADQQSASQDGQDRLLGQSLTLAKADLKRFVAELEKQHWQLSPFMLSSTEQAGFIVLDK